MITFIKRLQVLEAAMKDQDDIPEAILEQYWELQSSVAPMLADLINEACQAGLISCVCFDADDNFVGFDGASATINGGVQINCHEINSRSAGHAVWDFN